MKLYSLDRSYIDFLHKCDDKVRLEKDNKNSKTRKYVGVVLEINEFIYFAPLASPKLKHTTMKNDKDFLKINSGKYGAINFNNMIPAHKNNLINVDINTENDENYKHILIQQSKFIRKNKEKISKIAKNLYYIITTNDNPKEKKRLKRRCCNFKNLEKACLKFNS